MLFRMNFKYLWIVERIIIMLKENMHTRKSIIKLYIYRFEECEEVEFQTVKGFSLKMFLNKFTKSTNIT